MCTLSANRERQRSANHYFVIAIIGDMSFTCDNMVAYTLHFVFFDKMHRNIQRLQNAINKDSYRKHYFVTGKGDDVSCAVVTNC